MNTLLFNKNTLIKSVFFFTRQKKGIFYSLFHYTFVLTRV